MKLVIILFALINSLFMLLDGVYVLLKGKFLGPEKPGQWANVFYKFNINVFKLGPLFIVYGIGWLIFIIGFYNGVKWSYSLGLIMSICTLWYLPVGTLISIILFILLWFYKSKLV